MSFSVKPNTFSTKIKYFHKILARKFADVKKNTLLCKYNLETTKTFQKKRSKTEKFMDTPWNSFVRSARNYLPN